MDLLVEKLEEFELVKFIKTYRFVLCRGTINQDQVAGFLEFDSDQIAVINQPPDNYSKSGKLYELIEKIAEPRNFLEALNPTGNQTVLELIRSILIEPAASSSSQYRGNKINLTTGIWFNIPEPIDSFCGREDFLSQLHDKLQLDADSMSTPKVTVLSQVKIVSGLGGIGKTETSRRYIMKYRQFYNNFIWIDAKTDNSMTNSFVKLADELKIPVKNPDGKSRGMDVIIKEIYNKICEGGKSNLIVFDNAEDYESCKNFFPISLHPDLKKPVILATSRNQEWKSRAGKIQVLPLDVLTDAESLEFILTQLDGILDSPELEEESKEFIQLIGGLPLALQQAVAYIKNEKEHREFLGKSYEVDDYVQEFKFSMKKFLSFCPHPDSSATVFVTWNVTFQRIQGLENGESAVKILELLSFLYADKIPLPFLHDVVPEIQDGEFSGALKLLKKYSLVKLNVQDVCLSIHRQLQFVILQYLQECNDVSKVVTNLVEKCLVILDNIKLSDSDDIFMNVHQIVKNQFDMGPMTQKSLDFMYKFGYVLWEVSRYSESLDLYQNVHRKSRELLGENHRKTLDSQHMMALQLEELGRYDESLTLNRETLKQEEIHLGPDHPSTITTKYNIAEVLRQQNKYNESLELYQQILSQRIKIQGENHPETLSTQNGIAVLHSDLGDFPKALALYQDIEEKQTKILGPDHTDLLTTKHNKATVLFEMGKFEEAAKIFNKIYEKQKEILGENNLHTVITLDWVASTLYKQGKSEQALQLYKKAYEIRKTKLGENHPHTINVKNNVENVERKLREMNSLSSRESVET